MLTVRRIKDNFLFLDVFNVPVPFSLPTGPLITVRAVIGETALLPCDLSAPHPADTAILVLFFYQDKGTPIYR